MSMKKNRNLRVLAGAMDSDCCDSRLSDVTKRYLTRFYDILDEMIDSMTGAELNDSISHNFIVQMIPHHRAAIQMSENILQYTTNVPLQNIAKNIITTQTQGIEDMEKAMDPCAACYCNSEQDLCIYHHQFTQIAQVMFMQMKAAPASNDVNRNFICEMIPHHMGAIRMSENALYFDICPQLRPILQSIIASQTVGIQEMESLLRCL